MRVTIKSDKTIKHWILKLNELKRKLILANINIPDNIEYASDCCNSLAQELITEMQYILDTEYTNGGS